MVAVSSAAAGVLTWLLQAVAGRVLGPADYAAFMVVWAFVFIGVGLLQGVSQETTRAVAATVAPADPPRPGTPFLAAGLIGLGGALVMVASSPLWAESLFTRHASTIVWGAAFGFLAYSMFGAVGGALAARAGWASYSTIIGSEAVIRLALVTTVLLAGRGLGWQSWALTAAGATWLLFTFRPDVREAMGEAGDSALTTLIGKMLRVLVASGCSAVMITGFPLLLQLSERGAALPPESGVVIAAAVATRAPLLLPLNAFQGAILARFSRERGRILQTLVRLEAAVLAISLLGALAAFVVGPVLLRVLLGGEFQITGLVIAGFTVAAGIITMQSLAGMAMLSLDRQWSVALSWVAATAVTFGLLLTPYELETRSVLALVVGPLVGLVWNVVALAGVRTTETA